MRNGCGDMGWERGGGELANGGTRVVIWFNYLGCFCYILVACSLVSVVRSGEI